MINRLKKTIEAGPKMIGKGYFESGDLNFVDEFNSQGSGSINLVLVNTEKSLSSGSWKGKYLSGEENVIGGIQFETTRYSGGETFDVDDESKELNAIIFVNYLEVREEYRNTDAVWQLLDHFNENVIEDIASEYPDSTGITANFANQKLGRIIERYVKEKMDIDWVEDPTANDGPTRSDSLLGAEGINFVTINGVTVITNDNIPGAIGYYAEWDQDHFGGCVTSNGDIKIAITEQSASAFASSLVYPPVDSILKFSYEMRLMQFECNVADVLKLENSVNDFIAELENIIFGIGSITIKFNDGQFSDAGDLDIALQDLKNPEQELKNLALKKNRLKKRWN